MTNFMRALLDCEAIDSVRIELDVAVKANASSIVIGEIHARLMSLYASLDVHNIESIIHKVDGSNSGKKLVA